MRPINVLLLTVAVVATQVPIFSQTPRWQSMDGPYRPEERIHLRFPDGDRRFYGVNTGTFRTTNGGTTWENVGPQASSERTGLKPTFTITQSPEGVLFAHEAYIETYYHSRQVNTVFRSVDRGEHWEVIWHGGFTVWGGLAFGGADTVYMSYSPYDWATGDATSYVLQSTDAGTTWTTMRTSLDQLANLRIQNNNIFANYFWHGNSGVLRSMDLGITWQSIMARDAYFYPPNTLLRHLPRMINGYPVGPEASLEISTDEGSTWTRALMADSGFTSLVSDNIATILVLRKPGLELLRSTDAGHTWRSLGSALSGDPFTSLKFLGKTHVIGMTKAGSYYRSTDYGTTWMPILDPEGNPLAATLQYASDSLLVAADWRGNWLESDDAGGTWRSVLCSFANEKINCLLGLPSGSLLAGAGPLYRWREGQPWSAISDPSDSFGQVLSLFYRSGPSFFAGEPAAYVDMVGHHHSRLWTIDTACSTNGFTFWAGGSGDIRCIYLSANRWIFFGAGQEIEKQYNASGGNHEVCFRLTAGSFATMVEDSSHVLWAANDSLGLYKSLDTGLTWTASNAGLTDLHVLSMAVSPSGEIYAGTRGGGVFRSTDDGANWVSSGLPGDTVQALLAGKDFILYAGTSKGVFVTTDAGVSWLGISFGLTNTDVHALAEGLDGTIYCGTWGEGVFRLIGKVASSSGMVLVDGGTFSMGSTAGDPDEQPMHSVTLHSFYFDPKEVTVADYRAYCTGTGRAMPPAPSYGWTDLLPMVNVTWDDAAAYAAWKGKRLPTEAEWEYAARGGKLTHGYLYSGSTMVDSVAWDSLTSGNAPHAGGCKQPNELGLFDLSGNVWEWCSDWYDAAFYGVSPATDPRGPTPGAGLKVHRGGSFKNGPYACRVSDRTKFWFDSGLEDLGFRCAMDAPVSPVKNQTKATVSSFFALEQNYPNPFNPATIIKFTVGGAGSQGPGAGEAGARGSGLGARKTMLVVYDVLGRQVATLVNEVKAPGHYEVTFDGSKLASGIYICRMTAGSFVQSRKMLLLK